MNTIGLIDVPISKYRTVGFQGINKDTRVIYYESCLAEAGRLWKKGSTDQACRVFGQGLHSLQDVSAHIASDHKDWFDDPGAIGCYYRKVENRYDTFVSDTNKALSAFVKTASIK